MLMARISLIELQNASPEVKEIYEQTLKDKPGNVQKALAHRPQILKNFLGFYASVGKSLDRRLYEMVYIRVSMINRCHY
jgi:alkylhydroperoxidase family enzyme